jgi:hypothetical protein
MLRLKTSKNKKSYFHTLRKPGFTIPPENQLYECRPPKEEKVAKGIIIDAKGGYVKRRGGPASLGKISGDLTRAPVSQIRNRFQPTRQSFNKPTPRTSRVSDEERKRIKQEDVARNGTLVQVSDKTLNRVFDKFDLFTISNKILDLKRKGLMSKQEVRASALLKLTKEVMNAMREARGDEARVALDIIEEKHPGTLPRVDDLGTTPEEVAENPLLPISMLINAGRVNDETFLLLEDLIDNGTTIYLNPKNMMVNDIIPLVNILELDLEEIDDGLEYMQEGYAKRVLSYIVEQHKSRYPVVEDEKLIEDDEDDQQYDLFPQDILGLPEEMKDQPLQPRSAPPVPRDIPFMKQPINPPPILNPVEPTLEEVKEDEVYADVERGGNEAGEGLRQYVNQQTQKIMKIVKGIDRPPRAVYNDIKRQVKTAVEVGTTLLQMSNQPDEVLDGELVQDEIMRLMNIMGDITQELGQQRNFLEGLVKPGSSSYSGPTVEVMEDDAESAEVKLDDAIDSLNRPPKDTGEEIKMIDPNAIKQIGSKKEVYAGRALRTERGYTKNDLEKRNGKVYIKKGVRRKKK